MRVFKELANPAHRKSGMQSAAPLTFDELHTLNTEVPACSPCATFLTIMRVRDGKFQHLRRDRSIRIQANRDLSLRVESNTVHFSAPPAGTVSVVRQCTPYKLEALQKPQLVQELGFNFIPCEVKSNLSIALGLGDFMVVFKPDRIPDIIIFMVDRSMQGLWPEVPIRRVFIDLVDTFRRDTTDLQVHLGLYCPYVKRHIDASFVWWEFLSGAE